MADKKNEFEFKSPKEVNAKIGKCGNIPSMTQHVERIIKDGKKK